MKLSFARFAATALAGVIAVTASTAFADEPAPTPAPAASVVSAGTPLQTRPSKKLELAPQNESSSVGYKLLAGAVIVAGAVVYARKKKGGLTKDKTKKRSSIDLLARHSVGVRSEVLVVEVEGTRLLIGMTPGSMSTLAVLQTPEGVIGEESPLMGEEKYMEEEKPSARKSAPELSEEDDDEPALVRVGARKSVEPEEVDELEGRVRSLLEARKKRAPAPHESSPRVLPARKTAVSQASRVPGQAKGLLLSMQDADVTKLGDW
ncbi:MAG: flagellar biosynthetic protein FliO [Labilithrix sp.]